MPTPSADEERARPPLGELLIAAGLISSSQLESALYEGSQTGERIGEVVVRRGWATEDEVAHALADQWGLSYLDRASISFDADALDRLPYEEARRLEALPTRVEGGRVVVAVAEPSEERLAGLREVVGDDTVVVVVPKSALDAGLRSELLTRRTRADAEDPVELPPVVHLDFDPQPPLLRTATRSEPSAPSDSAVDPERVQPERPRPEPADPPRAESQPPAAASTAPPASTPREPEPDPAGVAALAAQARGIAELLATHAASMGALPAGADGRAAAGRIAELERRVERLETEHAVRRAAMVEARGLLLRLARILDSEL